MKFKNILIDADLLLYQVGFATQKNVYHVWINGHEGDPSLVMTDKRRLNKILKEHDTYEIHKYLFVQPFLSAKETIDAMIVGLKKRLGTSDCVLELFLTGDGNFREQVATIQPYKGNRTADKPVHYQKIKDYLISKGAQLIEGQEADDELSIQHHLLDSAVLCSIDKDLDQSPGWHYNSTKDLLYDVTAEQGTRWFYEQLLQGDSADNIPGLKGIGPAKSTKALAGCPGPKEMEDVCIGMYKEHHPDTWEERMIEVGQLLWMRVHQEETWYPLYRGGCVYK